MSTAIAAPSAAGATSAAPLSSAALGPGGKLGKDEFLKLLVAQLKHQDPMNPMDGQQMAAQLAQFSGVEQLVQLNQQMADQAAGAGALLQSANNNVALGTIGRTVVALGDALQIPASDAGAATVTFTVGDGGGAATLRLLNAQGVEVGRRPLGVIGGGRQTVELGAAATGLVPGGYRYAVDVTDAAGKPVTVQPLVTGTVDGVRYGADGAVLTSGPLNIDITKVVQVGR